MDKREAAHGDERVIGEIGDRERGLLASALLAACGETNVVAQLRLDSADPSLMSRADVARLLAHLRANDSAVLARALRDLREHPTLTIVLDGLFAPSRDSSDTSTLGGDPTEQGRPTRGHEEEW